MRKAFSVLSIGLCVLILACDDKPAGDGAASATESASAAPSVSAALSMTPSASALPSASASAAPLASAAPTTAAAAPPACGKKPLPDCPLQGWMKKNMGPAMSAADFSALAEGLDRIATFAPSGYPNWASIAKDGAGAARAADFGAVKAACRGCHDQYKKPYKTEMRTRPLP